MPHIWGVRTVGDGEFFCPGCGSDRSYLRRIGRHRFALLGIPLLPRVTVGTMVECAACRTCFRTDVLGHPTTTRFSAMLRDAVHTVALAVLAAGKEGIDGSRTALTIELHEVLDPLAPHLAPPGARTSCCRAPASPWPTDRTPPASTKPSPRSAGPCSSATRTPNDCWPSRPVRRPKAPYVSSP